MPEQNLIQQIFDFNLQVVKVDPEQIDYNTLTQKQFDWTVNFCQEELSEFKQAYEEQDLVAMCDAIGDLIYGAMGTFAKMGVNAAKVEQIFNAIHTANMSKVRGDKGRGSDEDAIKPEGFVPPEEAISDILFME